MGRILMAAVLLPLGLGCGDSTGPAVPDVAADTQTLPDGDSTASTGDTSTVEEDVDAQNLDTGPDAEAVEDTQTLPDGDSTASTGDASTVEADVDAQHFDTGPLTDAEAVEDTVTPEDGDSTASTGDASTVEEDVDTEVPPDPTSSFVGLVGFNEALIDADTDTLLDPNADGDLSPTDDEFVELLSLSEDAVDLSGWTLVDEDFPTSPRHTFASGATLAPGHAVVVFGGGEAPEPIDGAWFVVAQNADPGFSYGLHLTDAGNRLRLLDAEGLLVAELGYGAAGGPAPPEDQSLTRWPDGVGEWSPHAEVAPAGEIFSPGTRVDGAPFGI